jgi:D-glycero-alpha-D-manno-heptose-7-phosphate kinase
MIVRARAPLRISFSGGGTDLPPYPEEHGGLVLNATINRYAYATLRLLSESILKVNSLDFKTTVQYGLNEPLVYNGELDLIKACLNKLMPDSMPNDTGLELHLEAEVPAGSGLGGSSSVVVAAIGALRKWRHLPLDNYQMAHLAWEIEREDVGIPGGMQDQYAAVFGGFNLIEFYGPGQVIVNPLRIEPQIADELQYNALLVYIGPRTTANIIETQISGYLKHQPDVLEAMDRMKVLTVDAKNALLTGRLDDLGAILDEAWLQKKRTAASVTASYIDEMYEEAKRLGAIGGKVSGAGGGGFMFLYCPYDRKLAVAERLAQMGGKVSSFTFEFEGMKSWTWR